MDRLNIYFMHSDKYDYNNLIYKLLLKSEVCLSHNLILPYSKENISKYAKDLIREADIVIVDVYKPSFGLLLELRWLFKMKKNFLALSLDNSIPKKVKKYISEIVIHDEKVSYIKIIEEFINREVEKRKETEKNTYKLGEL